MKNILIVDDNKQIAEILYQYSKKEGYNPIIASNGEEALQLFNENDITIILLDVMMPIIDGFEVCRRIRQTSQVPIIMVTARGEDFERIMGLDIGADDYILKPFSPAEVMARVRAILRRLNKTEQQSNSYKLDNVEINIEEYIAKINNEELTLTKKEIEILYTLIQNPNRVFTREILLDKVWGFEYFGDSRTVDSNIKRLRAKLDQYAHPNWEIKTIWGVGYKLEVENV